MKTRREEALEDAEKALVATAGKDNLASGEDKQDAVTDLLTNIQYYCESNGLDFVELLDAACQHYDEEVGED